MKTFSLFLVMVFLFSCQPKTEKAVPPPAASSETPPSRSNADTTSHSIPFFTTEDAETLLAKYYSEQNQFAKYPYYKGLGLKIERISKIPGTDTFLVKAIVSGRKWLRPGQDTLTTPFLESKEFRAFRIRQIWWADFLRSPVQ